MKILFFLAAGREAPLTNNTTILEIMIHDWQRYFHSFATFWCVRFLLFASLSQNLGHTSVFVVLGLTFFRVAVDVLLECRSSYSGSGWVFPLRSRLGLLGVGLGHP